MQEEAQKQREAKQQNLEQMARWKKENESAMAEKEHQKQLQVNIHISVSLLFLFQPALGKPLLIELIMRCIATTTARSQRSLRKGPFEVHKSCRHSLPQDLSCRMRPVSSLTSLMSRVAVDPVQAFDPKNCVKQMQEEQEMIVKSRLAAEEAERRRLKELDILKAKMKAKEAIGEAMGADREAQMREDEARMIKAQDELQAKVNAGAPALQ